MMLQDVLETVNIRIYQYLHPKDLISLATCSRHHWNDIIQQLDVICVRHLPLTLGTRTNYIGELRIGSSFLSKAELLDFVMSKAEDANLLLVDTTTMEESRSRAMDLFLGERQNITTAKCYYSLDDGRISTIECYYRCNIEKQTAISWIHYILEDRNAFKRNVRDRDTYEFMKAWLDLLVSLQYNSSIIQHSNNRAVVSFKMWRWSCKHPKLNGQGIAGVGLTINVQRNLDATSEGNATEMSNNIIELRLTRMY